MEHRGTDRSRLQQAAEKVFDPESLVGSFFLSDATRSWQGVVVAEVAPAAYLVETFDWLIGSSFDQRLVPLSEMTGWSFYDDAEWMRNAYDSGVAAKWKEERQ